MQYHFNQFILDTERFELSKDGDPLAIEPQVIELISLLILHRHRLVSKEEINLWLMSNRLCVMPVASYKTHCAKLVEAEERLYDLEPKLRRLEAMKLGDLAEQNKHLKKKRASLKRKLERLKTNRVKRLLSLLAKARSRNRKAQPQTP